MMPMLMLLAAAAVDAGYWQALRAVDTRMATIAWRLQTRNAPLCRALQPAPGLQVHAIDQYAAATPAARAVFGFATPVQIETIAPGSAAALAGVAADDGLVAVNGEAVPVPTAATAGTSGTRDAADALIARQPSGMPLTLTLRRRGETRTVTVPASPGCRAAFEVLLDTGLTANVADGRIVQVGVKFFETLPDDKVAAVVAHELSHIILEHYARLEAAKVHWGLSEIGRNARLFRRTEDDADRLSVHLLHNAGYDPQAAVRFWREDGGKIDGGVLRGPSHGSAKARAAAIAAEIETLPPKNTPDTAPPVLATRDQPLD